MSSSKNLDKIRVLWTLILSSAVSILVTPALFIIALFISTIRLLLSIHLRFSTKNKVKLIQPMDSFQVFDRPHNILETYTLLIIQGEGDVRKIKTVISDRVINNQQNLYEKLKCRVVKKFGFYCWEQLEPEVFHLEDHVKILENDDLQISSSLNNDTSKASTEKQVFKKISEFYASGMDIGKPRWEIWIVPKFTYEQDDPSLLNKDLNQPHYAIILRMHHSLMDGISTYFLISRALADLDQNHNNSSISSMPIDPLKPLQIPLCSKLWNYLKLIFIWPKLLHENVGTTESNCYHGPALTEKKIVCWTSHFRLKALRKIRVRGNNGINFSTNAVLNAAVGGAFLGLAQTKGIVPVPHEITALTSIPMLPYPNLKPQNRFSGAFFPLLVGGVENKLDRIKATNSTLRQITSSPLILLNSILLRFIGILPTAWSVNMTDSREFTVLTSNIPGPLEPCSIFGGDKLVDVAGFLPIKNRTGFAFCFVSYCGNIRAAITADASVASEQDLEILKDAFENEILQMETDSHDSDQHPWMQV